MYGGLSLAVYMNGVAREFFDLVRGRGVWGVLKELADVDVTVDVLSGASAGGINALFLSYALCEDGEFRPLADLWREEGALARLLHEPGTKDAQSLLKSEHMRKSLVSAFNQMKTMSPDAADVCPTCTRELDCLLSVTDFFGGTEQVGDFREAPVLLKSYKAALHLKHRQGRKHPFRTLQADVLAKMACATSAFPIAFEPVEISGETLRGRLISNCNYVWDERDRVFIDGGVLDNAPFGLALPLIYERHADRPVDRLLFFVEPDPVRPGATPEPAGKPSFLRVGLASLASIPGHETIAEDIHALNEHNRKIDLLNVVYGNSFLGGAKGGASCEPDPQQEEIYLRARVYRVIEALGRELPHAPLERIRKSIIARAENEPRAFEAGAGSEGSQKQTGFPCLFEHIYRSIDRVTLEVRFDDSTRYRLDYLDIGYVLRAYYYWVYRLHERLESRVDEERTKCGVSSSSTPNEEAEANNLLGQDDILELRRKISHLSRRIDMLLFLEAAVFRTLGALLAPDEFGRQEADADPVVNGICALHPKLRSPEEFNLSELLLVWSQCLMVSDRVLETVTRSWKSARPLSQTTARNNGREGNEDGSSPGWFKKTYLQMWGKAQDESLSNDVLPTFVETLNETIGRLPGNLSAIDAFHCVDRWRYPMCLMSGLGEMDRIEYYRISPLDAAKVQGNSKRLDRWINQPEKKVTGTGLAHFAAFLKKPWRSNDIMWGRLDAASIIWEVLFQNKSNPSRARAAALINSPVFKALDARCRKLVRRFANTTQTPDDFKKAILEHHQETILEQELPNVVRDALEEEFDSGKQKAPKGAGSLEAANLGALLVCRDPFLRALARFAAAPGRVDYKKFFCSDCWSFGRSTLESIGRLRGAVLGVHAARVLTNMSNQLLHQEKSLHKVFKKGVNKASLGMTTIHLVLKSLESGSFPILWLILFTLSVALPLIYALAPKDLQVAAWPFFWLPLILLCGLLLLPSIWFGPRSPLRYVAFAGFLASFGYLVHLGSATATGTWLTNQMSAVPSSSWPFAGGVALVGAAALSWRKSRKARRRGTTP